jgi:uncharacterized protein (DUF1501 family)
MITRRQLLERTSLFAFLPATPAALARALARDSASGRALVVIELEGGNDGLATVVPFRDEVYAAVRPTLRVPEQDLLPLGEDAALHPALKPLAGVFERGRLAIVQGVSYPEPNLSHFRSRAIWHHARRDPEEHTGIGWLGRTLDQLAGAGRADARAVFVGSGPPPVAVRGTRAMASSLESLADFELQGELACGAEGTTYELRELVRRNLREAAEASRRFAELDAGGSARLYPQTELGARLAVVAQLLRAGFGASVLYTGQPGYDTHSRQLDDHARLLGELAGALAAFLDDLASAGREGDALVLVFSEFGRAVAENGSRGTDHGTAGPVFLAGAPVRGGILGAAPALAELVDGQLAVQHDLRRVYAALLEDWFGVESSPILGSTFERLPLLAG